MKDNHAEQNINAKTEGDYRDYSIDYSIDTLEIEMTIQERLLSSE